MKTILRWIHDRLPCPNEPYPFTLEDFQGEYSLCFDHYQDMDDPALWGDTYTLVTDNADCERRHPEILGDANPELETV